MQNVESSSDFILRLPLYCGLLLSRAENFHAGGRKPEAFHWNDYKRHWECHKGFT